MIPVNQLVRIQIKTSDEDLTPKWQDIQFAQLEAGDTFRYLDSTGNVITSDNRTEYVALSSPTIKYRL